MKFSAPGTVLAFHGCDKSVARKIVLGDEPFKFSTNDYDWLGHGIYFWENNPRRAFDYALQLARNPRPKSTSNIKTPFAVGAIIDLNRCLNLMESESIDVVQAGYHLLARLSEANGNALPENQRLNDSGDILLRNLDCAVIEMVHQSNREENLPQYDTVRAAFLEGNPLYRNAGFRQQNHIQICVRNPDCIQGVFIPPELIERL